LTTYSTFGYETVRLAENRLPWSAAANVVLSVAGGLVAALAGIALGHTLR
jgi:CrcB protein